MLFCPVTSVTRSVATFYTAYNFQAISPFGSLHCCSISPTTFTRLTNFDKRRLRSSARANAMAAERSGGPRAALHALHVSALAPYNRAHALLYGAALAALFYHRAASAAAAPAPLPRLLFSAVLLAEAVLAFMWTLTLAFRWRPVRRTEHPGRLLEAAGGPGGLPALDVFVCTADPHKEPPLSVASTVLSAMAFDYPPDRLSVYVSDDGGSAATLFAFMEAATFARYWLPFCKENGVIDRSPEVYFGSGRSHERSQKLKVMYDNMKEMVDQVLQRGHVGDDVILSPEERELFSKWERFTRQDHPSVVQVILNSKKDTDIMGNALPNLIYVSREKRPSAPHNFKAGSLNVLTRVSSVLTNAPVLLTLDCDTFCNDPLSPLRALCYFLDPAMSSNLAYVQFPQCFQGLNRDDIYASEFKCLYSINDRGMDGHQGPNFLGTGCFFARPSLHRSAASPPLDASTVDASLSAEWSLMKAHEVAGCTYERGTSWGSEIGFRYGSLTEDMHTSFHMKCRGWRSIFCDPQRSAFLGNAPKNLYDALSQTRRWVVGQLEMGLARHNPIVYGAMKASLLTGFSYAYYCYWGTWFIPIVIYGFLPPLALVHGVPLFPKVSDPWFYLYAYLFLAAYGQSLLEFLLGDGTVGQWWSDQRMWMIRGLTSFLFGSIEFLLKQVGVSASGFHVTSKVVDQEQNARYESGVFDFGVESPFFVSLGTAAVVNLSSFLAGASRAAAAEGFAGEMFVQLFLSGFAVVNCLPVYEAMFLRSDGGRMPRKTTVLSLLLAGLLHSVAYACFRARGL